MRAFVVTDGVLGDRGPVTLDVPDETYRLIALRGATYTEETFRKWVASVWGEAGRGCTRPVAGLTEKSPLADLVRACAHGGWKVLEVL
jgi:hypothetical protein